MIVTSQDGGRKWSKNGRLILLMPHGSPGTIFLIPKFLAKLNGSPPTGVPYFGRVG